MRPYSHSSQQRANILGFMYHERYMYCVSLEIIKSLLPNMCIGFVREHYGRDGEADPHTQVPPRARCRLQHRIFFFHLIHIDQFNVPETDCYTNLSVFLVEATVFLFFSCCCYQYSTYCIHIYVIVHWNGRYFDKIFI